VGVETPRLTELVARARSGRAEDREALFAAAYAELQGIARRAFREERAAHTLEPTAVVHEAYIRAGKIGFEDRRHFFFVMTRAMRQVLIDHARRRQAKRRGGDVKRVRLETDLPDREPVDVLELETAFERLRQELPRKADIAELRLYGGFSASEIATTLECSTSTVEKDWRFARAWLVSELSRS